MTSENIEVVFKNVTDNSAKYTLHILHQKSLSAIYDKIDEALKNYRQFTNRQR